MRLQKSANGRIRWQDFSKRFTLPGSRKPHERILMTSFKSCLKSQGNGFDIGIDDERENEDDISDEEEAARVQVTYYSQDNPENRIKALKKQLQRDKGLQHRTLALQDRLSWDTEMFATEQQVKEIQQLPLVAQRIKEMQEKNRS